LGVLLITHYTRILRYIRPDFVHGMVNGRIVEEGGSELADRLEDEGYDRYLVDASEPAGGGEAEDQHYDHDRDAQPGEVRRGHRSAQGRHGPGARDQRRRPGAHLRPQLG